MMEAHEAYIAIRRAILPIPLLAREAHENTDNLQTMELLNGLADIAARAYNLIAAETYSASDAERKMFETEALLRAIVALAACGESRMESPDWGRGRLPQLAGSAKLWAVEADILAAMLWREFEPVNPHGPWAERTAEEVAA